MRGISDDTEIENINFYDTYLISCRHFPYPEALLLLYTFLLSVCITILPHMYKLIVGTPNE